MKAAWAGHALAAISLLGALMQVACSGGGSAQSASTTTTVGNSGANGIPPTPSLRIATPSPLPNALDGQPYSQMLQASGGTSPYTWTIVGPCPAGISLSASGLLSGTPTGSGNYGCFVQVADSSSPRQTASQVMTFLIIQALTIAAPMPAAPPSVRNPYSELFWANGGFGPYSWSIQSGSLPPGLTLVPANYNASISGVPTARGTYNFTLQVTDTGPPQQTTTQAISLTVFDYPQITTTSLPVGLTNYPYNVQLQAIGGTPPYSWSAPRLPGGLQLNSSSGTLSGTPIVQWYQPASFTVTDSSVPPLQSTSNLFLDINTPLAFTQSQPALPDAVQGQPYTYPLPFQGGLPPFAISVTGSLPPGISVPASGANGASFSGSPSANGTSNFTLTIQDSQSPNPAVIQQAFSIRVNPQLVLTNAQPTPGVVGLSYSFQFQASGGVQPYRWVSPGSFDGLTTDPITGLMSGTPIAANSFTFGVVVQDSSNPYQTAVVSSGIRIYDKLRSTTSALPPIAPNVPLKMQLAASGGTGNYIWLLTQGTLPPGLGFAQTGQFYGQATQTGSFPVTFQLGDPGPPLQTAYLTTTITVSSSLSRNDSPATATPLSNGTYQASISPIADPPSGVLNADSDYYVLTANPGAIVTIDIMAQRLAPPSPLDSVLEIVDANNQQLSFCSLYSFGPFNTPCVDDDLPGGGSTDSTLYLQVPPGNSGPLTFYAHVLDWRGDARPDFIYTITVAGAN